MQPFLQTVDHLPVLHCLLASLQWKRLLSTVWQHRLRLTLSQVTTDEIDAATKLLDKAKTPRYLRCTTDLETAIRQLRQLSCILKSCTIAASCEVSQAQKALLLMPRTAKVQAYHPVNWTHRCHCQQMMNITPFKIKTSSRTLAHWGS